MREGFVFYAYWNGAQMRDLFEALVSVTSGANYVQLAGLLFLIGIVFMLAAGSTRAEAKSAITYFACGIFFWFVVMVPKVTVIIEDTRSEAVWTVDNVPLGIAVPGSIANQIGHWLTETYETAFTPVDVAKFSKFGAVYPERVVEALQAVGPVTVRGQATLQAVVKGCVIPELLTDAAKTAAVAASTDLWTTIAADGWVNPARMTAMPDGTVKTCSEALTELQTVLADTELPAVRRLLGTKLAPDHADPGAVLTTALPASEELLLNLSRTMDASLRHSVMMTGISTAVDEEAQVSEPLALTVALAKAQGNMASEINYRTMARIAEDTLPKIRNALEFVVIGMFPIMVLVALAAGSAMGGIVRAFITLLVTVQIWPALSSVVNYLMIAYDAHPFTAIVNQFGGNSMQAAALIREAGASSQAVAGALMCAVPLIAYALVRAGDVAVGQLVGGLTGPAQAAASAQGASLAAGNVTQGNVSLGNVSSNNVNANKADASIRAVESGILSTQSAYGSVTRSAGGTVTGVSRTAIDTGVSSQTSQDFVRGQTVSNVAQTSSLETQASTFNFSRAAASSDSSVRAFTHAFRDALANEQALGYQGSDTRTFTTQRGLMHGTDTAMTDGVGQSLHVNSAGRVYFGADPASDASATLGNLSGGLATGTAGVGAPMQMAAPNRIGGTGSVVVRGGQVPGPVHPDAGGNIPTAPATAGIPLPLPGIHLGTQLSADSAQQVLDQATGRTGAQDSQQSARAYAQVESALERVATTHTDEAVRSQARNMLHSLSQTRTGTASDTRAFVSSQSAIGNLGETRRATVHTQSDNAVDIMRAGIERHGSAEGLLRASYERSQREALAAGDYLERSAVSNTATYGPGTIVSAREANATFAVEAQRAVTDHGRGLEARVGTVDLVTPNAPTSTAEFEGSFAERSMTIAEQAHTGQRDMDFERGVLILSREAYRRANNDENWAVQNAFFGGLGYRNPSELQDKLRVIASDRPELKEEIRSIGTQGRGDRERIEWERLAGLVRMH